MKILSEHQLREHFTQYSDFRFQNSALVRQYSSRGRLSRKNAMASAITEGLASFLPAFALIDPADVNEDTVGAHLLKVWRGYQEETRSIEEAPYHLFENDKDRVSLFFLVSLSLQSAWRTCIWSMDASTSILMSEREYFHVNCSRSDLLNLLDEKWREISMMVTA
jgi:hypothetical protein